MPRKNNRPKSLYGDTQPATSDPIPVAPVPEPALRASWGHGPWTTEPDHAEFVDSHSGYTCVVWRHPHFGSLCGYVRVPSGHPCHGDPSAGGDLDVHGGVTFSGHRPAQLEDSTAWWVGFDCCHANDLTPLMKGPGPVYRDITYVRKECQRLASQLKALEKTHVD